MLFIVITVAGFGLEYLITNVPVVKDKNIPGHPDKARPLSVWTPGLLPTTMC